ncbi:MAG: TolC family protein [Planctomycetales bacterium]|nr:TolC family protein [Planctomycetales bacterium]
MPKKVRWLRTAAILTGSVCLFGPHSGCATNRHTAEFSQAVTGEPTVGRQARPSAGSYSQDTASDVQLVSYPPPAPEPSVADNSIEAMPTEVGSMELADQFVVMALSTNPALQAQRQRIALLRYRIPQVRSLPNPTVSETFWPFEGNALQTAGGRAASQINLSQAVPWPEKLDSKAAIASREVCIALAKLREMEQDVVQAVRLAVIEANVAAESLAIVDEANSLVDGLNEVAETRYRAGGPNASQRDVLRAQIERERIAEERLQWTKRQEIAKAELVRLLHQPLDLDDTFQWNLAPVHQLELQLDQLVALAQQQNPSLSGLAQQVARDRQQIQLASLENRPDFQVGMNWLIVSQDDAISPVANGHDNFGFMVGMTLPVWRNKIHAGIQEARHQVAASTQMLASETDNVASQIRKLLAEYTALSQQENLVRTRIAPRLDDALDITLADYSGNRTDFSSLIELHRERLMVELQVLQLQAELARSLVRIQRQIGGETMPSL